MVFLMDAIKEDIKFKSIPSVFDWAKDVTRRRQLITHHLPEKQQKVDHVDMCRDNENLLSATYVDDW